MLAAGRCSNPSVSYILSLSIGLYISIGEDRNGAIILSCEGGIANSEGGTRTAMACIPATHFRFYPTQ